MNTTAINEQEAIKKEPNIFKKVANWYKINFVEASTLLTLVIMLVYGIIVSAAFENRIQHVFSDFGKLHFNYIKDPIAAVGWGNTIINAVIIGSLHFSAMKLTRTKMTAVVFTGYWMVVAYSFFGLNIFGWIAIIFGAMLLSLFKDKKINTLFVAISLGTSATPVVSAVSFPNGMDLGWWGFSLTFGLMILIGLILPELGAIFYKAHEGHSLGNTGIAAGIPLVIVWAFMVAFGATFTPLKDFNVLASEDMYWYHPFIMFGTILSIHLIITLSLFPLKDAKGFIKIFHHHGKWPADFVQEGSPTGVVINAFVLFLFVFLVNFIITLTYDLSAGLRGVELFSSNATFMKAGYAGMTGVVQVFAFSVFGKGIKPAFFISLGVLSSYFFMVYSFPNSPAAKAYASAAGLHSLLGLITFSWLLSPIIKYGWTITIITGMIHFFIVRNSGSFHGGMFMYNTGLSTVFTVPVTMAIARTFNLDPDVKVKKD